MSQLPDCYFQNDLRSWVLDLVRQKMPSSFTVRDVYDVMQSEVPVTVNRKQQLEILRRVNGSLKSLVTRKLLTSKNEPVPDFPVMRKVYIKTDLL